MTYERWLELDKRLQELGKVIAPMNALLEEPIGEESQKTLAFLREIDQAKRHCADAIYHICARSRGTGEAKYNRSVAMASYERAKDILKELEPGVDNGDGSGSVDK